MLKRNIQKITQWCECFWDFVRHIVWISNIISLLLQRNSFLGIYSKQPLSLLTSPILDDVLFWDEGTCLAYLWIPQRAQQNALHEMGTQEYCWILGTSSEMKCIKLYKIVYFQPNSTAGDYFKRVLVLVRYFVDCPSVRICLMSFSWSGWS